MQPVTCALFHTHKRKTQNSALCYSFQKSSCKQGLVWDQDLTYSTQGFFCEAAKICKLPRNKTNRPICTCVLQTRLNDTVWERKSLQVLISGNLCLKVKHFSSSGPILVTTQPLSVTHSLPPCLMQRNYCKPKMPGANRENPRGSKSHSSHLMRDRRDCKNSCNTSPLLCVWETGWINTVCTDHGQLGWGEGRRPHQALQVCQNQFSKYSRKSLWFLIPTLHAKITQKGGERRLTPTPLCHDLHLLFPLLWWKLLLITVTEKKLLSGQ